MTPSSTTGIFHRIQGSVVVVVSLPTLPLRRQHRLKRQQHRPPAASFTCYTALYRLDSIYRPKFFNVYFIPDFLHLRLILVPARVRDPWGGANTGDHRDGLILIWIRACYMALQWCDCYTYLSTERCPNIYSTNPGAVDPIARVLLLYK